MSRRAARAAIQSSHSAGASGAVGWASGEGTASGSGSPRLFRGALDAASSSRYAAELKMMLQELFAQLLARAGKLACERFVRRLLRFPRAL